MDMNIFEQEVKKDKKKSWRLRHQEDLGDSYALQVVDSGEGTPISVSVGPFSGQYKPEGVYLRKSIPQPVTKHLDIYVEKLQLAKAMLPEIAKKLAGRA